MAQLGDRKAPAGALEKTISPKVQPAFGTAELLAYADRLRAMGPAETASEIARLSNHPDPQHAMFSNLQLAVALTQTRNPQDTMRAQTLLQRVLAHSDDEARSLHPLARLLASRVADQRRLEDQVDKQAQQLRDSQRRIDQLNERLEAVRAIERSLTRNGNPLAAPAVPVAPNPAGAARP
jgi:DNA repair ATPase RecN